MHGDEPLIVKHWWQIERWMTMFIV